MTSPVSYREVEARLGRLERFADKGKRAFKPGLERILALLESLDNPHQQFPAVHIAGTNGKGSTASMIAAACTASGLRAGLHTSPHLLHVGERMRVDGEPAQPDWLAETLDLLEPVVHDVGASFFEATLALSLAFFAERAVDLAIVEVGLGGRLDGTNVVQPILSLITHIGLDHTALLGDTIEEIAAEKAGILRAQVPALSGHCTESVRTVLRKEADRRPTLLEFVDRSCAVRQSEGDRLIDVVTPSARYEALRLELVGEHQARNAALAVRALEYLHAMEWETIDEDSIRRGLGETRHLSGIRGRSEILRRDPPLMVDVAHNPEGLSAALESFRTSFPDAMKPQLLLAVMADKDLDGVVAVLEGRISSVQPVQLPTPRARSASSIESALRGHLPVRKSLPGAAEAASWCRSNAEMPILVVGSFRLVGPFLYAWDLQKPNNGTS